jgi:sulfur-carrier protein
VTFAKAFQRHVDCPHADIDGDTVRVVLDGYFQDYPAVRGYVLDDRDEVRRHVAVFVDSDLITDRTTLADAVQPTSTISVFQALSGGAT